MKIVLDAGHGGRDSGCRSVVDGYFESTACLDIAKRTREILAPHMEVLMTREGDDNISLRDRCKLSNESDADLYVSLHINFATTDASGYEVFTSRGVTRADELALKIASAHVEDHPSQRNRGVKEAGYYVLKHTKCPACLVEFGFFSNPTEARWLAKQETRQGLAESLAKGILNFCGKEQEQPLTLEERVSAIEKRLGI